MTVCLADAEQNLLIALRLPNGDVAWAGGIARYQVPDERVITLSLEAEEVFK